jgi:hypothetical protein
MYILYARVSYIRQIFMPHVNKQITINSITSKANKTLGFLRRNLKIPSIRIKEQAYFTLARPLVEYASTVWDPYTHVNHYIGKSIIVRKPITRGYIQLSLSGL